MLDSKAPGVIVATFASAHCKSMSSVLRCMCLRRGESNTVCLKTAAGVDSACIAAGSIERRLLDASAGVSQGVQWRQVVLTALIVPPLFMPAGVRIGVGHSTEERSEYRENKTGCCCEQKTHRHQSSRMQLAR